MSNLQLTSERDIARASTLPAPAYFSPETFEAEKASLFASTWQLVGHVGQAANPGDYFTFDLIGEPLLIVRGDDRILRGFYNVCRHRAGNPASGCGNRKLFRCAYHGWTYRLDGALLVTPEFEGVEDFDPYAVRPRSRSPRGMVQPYLRQSRSQGSSVARVSGRVTCSGREVRLHQHEVLRAPHL